MKCYTCKERMKCIDDVNTETTRIDWFACPKCQSKATVNYGNNGEYASKVEWVR